MTTVEEDVGAGADDAYNTHNGAGYNETLNRLLNGYYAGVLFGMNTGIRFQTVAIAQGATITSADLTVIKAATFAGSPDIEWYGVDVDDLDAWAATTNEPVNATHTTASTQWTPSDPGDGTAFPDIDLTDAVQEIIDRGSWASGNDLGFVNESNISTGLDVLDLAAYEHTSLDPAHLVIVVEDAGANPRNPLGHPLSGALGGPIG